MLKTAYGILRDLELEVCAQEVRILGEYLQDLTVAELETVAQKAEIKMKKKKGGKRAMVLQLLEPTHLETVRRVVAPEEVPAERITVELLEQVEDVLDSVALARPWGAGRRATPQEAQQGAQKEGLAEPPLQCLDPTLEGDVSKLDEMATHTYILN